MHLGGAATHERLRGADHDAAVAADEQRHRARLREIRGDALADAVPGDARTRPAPDRWDRVVRQVARNRHVTVVDGAAAGALQTRDEAGVAVGLRVVLAARI